jgi:pyruvate formate lyase activating enzyme
MGVEIGSGPQTLEALLKERTIAGGPPLVEPLPGHPDWVRCLACGHRCRIPPGQPGICKVRFNEGGRLMVPFGYVASAAVDPVEKKPFFHVLPGAAAMSFGMLGCDLHCSFCQNWFSSQILRETAATHRPQDITAETLLEIARDSGSRLVVSTYNEPLITTEWALAIFRMAKEESFVTGYVSNGNATPEVLDLLRPVTDLFKVDLKCFDDKAYRSLGAVLANILDTLEQARQRGFWVEVVTLLVPGFNDSEPELREMTRWLARLDPMIPWHVTAFHPDYKMSATHATTWDSLRRAAEIGMESGIKYVYAGNRPGEVGEWENTRCHSCGETVIRRYSFRVTENRLDDRGTCPECGTHVPGVWG